MEYKMLSGGMGWWLKLHIRRCPGENRRKDLLLTQRADQTTQRESMRKKKRTEAKKGPRRGEGGKCGRREAQV